MAGQQRRVALAGDLTPRTAPPRRSREPAAPLCPTTPSGHLFRVTTWGESHGPAIGCVVDGCPPRIAVSEAEIQTYMDKRRPGQSRFTTQRRESDTVKILSGVFADETTGAANHRHPDRAPHRE